MSWINDVKHDLGKLDVSLKSLRKFGLTVGTVFLLLFTWFALKDILYLLRFIFLFAGILLILLGAVSPAWLRSVYKVWMGLAFAMGWLVSRIILTLLFFLVLFPIGMLAKVFRKKFIDAEIDPSKRSYWVNRQKSKINYEKMF